MENTKRLYITDLDGTLLGSDCKISSESAEMLSRCIADGVNFSFATARSAASAVKIAECLEMNIPCILMNGVCVYDMKQRKYIQINYISAEASKKTAELLDRLGQSGFIYKITDDRLICSYNRLDNAEMREFYRERKDNYDKPFTQTEELSSAADSDVMYFTLLDKYEKLERVRRELESISGLTYAFYKDIYSEDAWYLEIFSDKASKFNGVKFLRERHGFEEVIGFGDNLNDLPLFEACDIKIAVGNAKDEVRQSADAVIGTNLENSVAEYIFNHERTYKP